ncbi:MAG: Poly-beta,6-N-acetyl-D-glucosamine synthase [Chloroflexota bacterium]|jgi:cellulose synthase/poly-beta-1,6-N-acetylglucosamine synthase-like glycosyltransferase
MSVAVFWGAVAVIVYTYVLFPALVFVRGRLVRKPYHSAPITPPVSLIIAAHNEAGSIGAKLENVLGLDYPRDRLEVVVASDGSTDGTDAIVAGFAARGVRLLSLPRQGKAGALNAAVAASTGEILVFSDANSMYAAGALRALASPFADPAVGGVAGNQRYLDEREGRAAGSESSYWSFDRRLKRAQSGAGNAISATGAIYAIRRALFLPVPNGVTDDFVTSTRVIAQGYRLVFAPDAVAYEPPAATSALEFGRKVRVMTRGLRGVIVMRELLNPACHGFYALQLLSHKVLRRLVALPLLALLLVSPFVWAHGPIYQAAVAAQVLVYGLGLTGLLLRGTSAGRLRLVGLPFFFCMVNAAALCAVWNIARGRRIDLWQPQRADAALTVAAEGEMRPDRVR